MIKRFLIPIIYSFIYIVLVCVTFYCGFINLINKAAITGWLLIVPFCVIYMVYVKKQFYGSVIGGKSAAQEGFKFIIYSTLILVVFQAVFFVAGFKEYKVNFIQTHGVELAKLQIKNGNLKINESEIPSLIQLEIEQVTLFKELTSILFKNLFLGAITTIICAVAIRNTGNSSRT